MISPTILNLCLQKKEQGYSALYNDTLAYVLWIVKRYVNGEQNQKDLTQEVYARVFTNLEKFDHKKGTFQTWLRKVAVNECLSYLRNQKKIQFLVPLIEDDENILLETIDLSSLNKRDMDIILKEMPSGYKTIFLLVEIDGFSHDEVSKHLKITKQTSRSQLARAKKWLRKTFSNKLNSISTYGTI